MGLIQRIHPFESLFASLWRKRRNQEEPASMARSQRILEYRPHTEPHVQHHFQL